MNKTWLDSPVTTIVLLLVLMFSLAAGQFFLNTLNEINLMWGNATNTNVSPKQLFVNSVNKQDLYRSDTFQGDLVEIYYGGDNENDKGRIKLLDKYTNPQIPVTYEVIFNKGLAQQALYFTYSFDKGVQTGTLQQNYDKLYTGNYIKINAMRDLSISGGEYNYDYLVSIYDTEPIQ